MPTPEEPEREDEEPALPDLPDAEALRRLFPPEVVEEADRFTAPDLEDEDGD